MFWLSPFLQQEMAKKGEKLYRSIQASWGWSRTKGWEGHEKIFVLHQLLDFFIESFSFFIQQ